MQGLPETLLFGLQPGHFLPGQERQLGFRRFFCQQRPVVPQIVPGLQVGRARRDEFLEPRIFLRQLLRLLRMVKNPRIAERGFDLGKAPAEFFNQRFEIHDPRAVCEPARRPAACRVGTAGRREKTKPPASVAHGLAGGLEKARYFFFFLPASKAAWAAAVLAARC